MATVTRVLAVGGHAADMEFTAGPTIAKYTAAGAEAVFLHLTAGEMGHPRLSGQEYAKQKIEEAHRAAGILGAEARFLPYPDAGLPRNDEVAYQIADVIREVRPDVLITHWRGSFHSDHVNTHYNTMQALFYAGLPAIKRAHPAHSPSTILFPENWEDMDDFAPDLFLDISDVYDRWIEAASQYELFSGSVSGFRYREYYEALAVMRGCLAGFKRAVALMRPRSALITRTAGLP
ncbi:MAG TPA: PIG-L family deacetylase [Chloroflexota bacterium]|nr:PIG-L family deacetylase [Chloroflexota bacterium]